MAAERNVKWLKGIDFEDGFYWLSAKKKYLKRMKNRPGAGQEKYYLVSSFANSIKIGGSTKAYALPCFANPADSKQHRFGKTHVHNHFMAIKIFVSAILVLTLVSCDNTRTQDNSKQETPKALEDESSSYDIRSKRGYDDLVESLYSELVSKNIDLKKLEDKIDELDKDKNDATGLFDKFREKNLSYFSAANGHIAAIKDSVLRNKMRNIVSKNLKKYNASIIGQNELLKIIDDKNLTISDLHNVLKIVKTLPLIEKYQHNNLPSAKSFKGYIKQQEEAINLADSLTKK